MMQHIPPICPMRYVLLGDGNSPHLLKWARALAPLVDLWACSTRGFGSEWDAYVPAHQRLALDSQPSHAGGNVELLRHVPQVGRWLAAVDADWINAHYLTSSGTLAVLAQTLWRLRGRIVASAWGSDVLVAPQRHVFYRWATQAIVRRAALCTSDSQHMTRIMQQLGAQRVLTFPFGLDALPPVPQQPKQPWLFYANRGLEPIYRPQQVLECFALIARWQQQARLVVANSGSMLPAMQQWVQQHGLQERVTFVGRLSVAEQARWYDQAQWYISLPQSDSVAVSVLEAMAHGCIPLLSDLPANHEVVRSGDNGLILVDNQALLADTLPAMLSGLLARAPDIARHNRQWVQQHGLFAPAIAQLVQQLMQLTPLARTTTGSLP